MSAKRYGYYHLADVSKMIHDHFVDVGKMVPNQPLA
jgi:hypothetical protein